jgi:hypothetical protein
MHEPTDYRAFFIGGPKDGGSMLLRYPITYVQLWKSREPSCATFKPEATPVKDSAEVVDYRLLYRIGLQTLVYTCLSDADTTMRLLESHFKVEVIPTGEIRKC